MLVTISSPPPRRATSSAHPIASMPVACMPPREYVHQPPSPRAASIATTTHWVPSISASVSIRSGVRSAAELTEILSAPASRSSRARSGRSMPPPTQSGTSTRSAARSTARRSSCHASACASMFSHTISSAPAAA